MSERLTAEKALERLYEAATDTPAQPNNADELRETVARRLRTDPEADDPEGLVEEDPLEALELTDAEKADLYYRRWQGLREAAEAVCDFPMHDDDSPLAEAVRALRDRLQADQGADDGAD